MFDLIELNGDDLRRDPLEMRKETLAMLLSRAAPGIRFNEHIEEDGPNLCNRIDFMKNLDNKVSNVCDRKNLELETVLHDNLRWQRNCCFMLDLRRPTFLFHWDITMSKFFFHVTSKVDFVHDFKGRELTDLAAAHRHAMLLIHKMVSLDDMDWRGWSINVTDASNRSLLNVLFPQMSFSQSSNRKNAK